MLDRQRICLCVVLLLLAAARPAAAHKMLAHGRVYEDGTVLLQAFFPDGKPARGVAVQVRRPDGSLGAEGVTDEKGKFTLSGAASPGRWTATFTGTMGHRVTTEFEVVEGEAAADAAAARPPADLAAPSSSVATAPPPAPPAPSGRQAAERDDLRVKEPFPWGGILAGLGFILGLCALLMCLGLKAELRRLKAERRES